jgi:hypothetical protein
MKPQHPLLLGCHLLSRTRTRLFQNNITLEGPPTKSIHHIEADHEIFLRKHT